MISQEYNRAFLEFKVWANLSPFISAPLIRKILYRDSWQMWHRFGRIRVRLDLRVSNIELTERLDSLLIFGATSISVSLELPGDLWSRRSLSFGHWHLISADRLRLTDRAGLITGSVCEPFRFRRVNFGLEYKILLYFFIFGWWYWSARKNLGSKH